MNDQIKSKVELKKELTELRQEIESLKASFDKEITERKLLEEKLHNDEQQLSLIFNTVGDVIYHLTVEADEKYRFISVNQAFRNVTGLSHEQVVGKLIQEVIPEPSLKIVLEKYKQAIDEKRIIQWEETTDYPTGRLTGEVRIAPVYSAEGRCTNLVGSVHDITGLKQKEEKLIFITKAIESSGEAIAIYDSHGHFYYYNNAFSELFKYSNIEESENHGAAKAVFKDPAIVQEIYENIMAGKSWTGELEMVTKNGLIFPAYGTADSIKDKDGKIVGFIGITKDITERKMFEHSLRQSEERYRTLIENRGEGVCFLNSEDIFVVANPTAEKIFGVEKGKLTGLCLSDFLFGDDMETVKNETQKRRQGQTSTYEHEIVLNDGIKKDLVVTTVPCLNETRFIGTFAIFNDITERKKTEVALRESEEKYRVLLEGSILGILAFDIETHQCSFFNSAACKLFGYSEEEIIRLNLADFHPKDSIEKVINEFESQGCGEKLISSAMPYLRKDGTIFYADIAGHSTTLNGRNCSIGFIMDVTERKKAEALVEQTRQNYEGFFNTIDEFLFVLDEQGNIIHANSTVYDRLGYTRDELFGKSVLMVHLPDRRDEAGRIIGEMLMGAAQFCPIPVQTKSGVQIPVETRVTRGFWNGKPVIFGVTKDISQVRLSEEKFSKLFHINPSACGLSDLETRQYIEVNEVFSKLFGFEKSEVIGKTALELGILTPESSNAIQLHADSNGRIFNVEANLKAKNDEIKHVMLSAENIYVQDKKYRFTVVYDITELKRVENVLRKSEASLRDAQEVARLGSFVWDISIGLWTSSTILDTIFGIDETYIRSLEGWVALIHPDWRDTMFDYVVHEVLGKHQRFDKEYIIINHKNGEEHWVHGLAELEMDKDNQPVKLIGTITDISDRKKAEQVLTESEEKYRVLLDGSSYGILAIDVETHRFVFSNPAIGSLFGYTGEEFQRLSIEDLVPKESLDLVMSEFASQMRKEKSVSFAQPCVRKDGTTFFADISGAPIVLKGRKCSVGFFNDVTDRKQAQEALRESEQKFSDIMTNLDEGYYCCTLEGLLLGYNVAFQRIFGFDPNCDMKGVKIPDLWQNPKERSEYMGKLMNDGFIRNYLVDTKTISGDKTAVMLNSHLVKDENGKVVKIEGILTDFTDRKRMEGTLDNERLMMRTLIDNIPDSIYSKDLAGRKTLVNLAEVRFMGAKSETEILGKNDFEVYPKELAESFFADDQEVMQTGKPILNREEYIFDEKEQKRYLLTSKLPLQNKDGQIIGLIGIGRDITRRKQAEEEMKLKNEQLLKTNAEKDKFFSIIAHDLRSPFQPLLGFTRMLVEDLSTMSLDEIQKIAGTIRKSATNLFRLLENLLEWSRMQQGLVPFTPETIQLHELVEAVIPVTFEPAKIKKIELTFEIPGNISVFADGNMLQSVMRNLISNAIKFTPKGGRVNVSAKTTGDNSVEISVRDNGIGISPEMVDNLFRLDLQTYRKGTEGEPSSGLGLIICKDFIEKHSGKLWLESEEGNGSTFFFTLFTSQN